jgi:hypothetical protein
MLLGAFLWFWIKADGMQYKTALPADSQMTAINGVAFYRVSNAAPTPSTPTPAPATSKAPDVTGYKKTEGKDFSGNSYNLGGSDCTKNPAVCGTNCKTKADLKGLFFDGGDGGDIIRQMSRLRVSFRRRRQ